MTAGQRKAERVSQGTIHKAVERAATATKTYFHSHTAILKESVDGSATPKAWMRIVAQEERVLLNAVEISGCEGTLLERAKGALTLRPNLAYTLSEVQEEVQRVFDTGYFKSCQPVVDETRDGIKLTIQVRPAFLKRPKNLKKIKKEEE